LRFYKTASSRFDDNILDNNLDNDYFVHTNTQFDKSVNWVDLCKYFEKTPITIKGCYNFKLKNVGNALFAHGIIDTKWETNTCDGFTAMLEAINIYKSGKCIDNDANYKDIIKYNEIDCKVMWEILKYIKKIEK
jgi:hypothetical protein